MKNKIFKLFAASMLFAGGCYEDKGNYDYLVPNVIDFSMIAPTNRNATIGQRFTYTPTLAFSKGEEKNGEFEYWWEYMGTVSAYAPDVETVCTGKAFDMVMNKLGEVRFRLCAKELATGIISSAEMRLVVTSLYSGGWAVLSEVDSRSSLSMIIPGYIEGTTPKERMYTEYKDVFQSMYGDLGTGPIAIRQTLASEKGTVMILQRSGAQSLNGESLEPTVPLSGEFGIGHNPDGFEYAREFYYGGRIDAVIDQNGYIYTRNYRRQGEYMNDFHVIFFSHVAEEVAARKISIDRVLATNTPMVYFYGIADNGEQTLYWVKSGNGNDGLIYKSRLGDNENPTDYVDLNDFGGYELIFGNAFNQTYNASNFISVFKKGDVVKVQKFRAETDNYYTSASIITEVVCRDVSTTMDVDRDSRFYMPRWAETLFFATGDKLYFYSISTGQIELKYTFGDGEKVVGITSNPQESELGIALESGKIIILNISNYSEISQKYATSGYGKIVDFQYKFKHYFAYSSNSSNYAD